MIYGLAGNSYFEDPANCANVAGQFGNSVRLSSQPAIGQYCGSVKSGYFTIDNGDEQVQFYLHSTYDLNDNLQIYGDTLLSHDVVRFNVGQQLYESDFDTSSPLAYYEDPRLPPRLPERPTRFLAGGNGRPQPHDGQEHQQFGAWNVGHQGLVRLELEMAHRYDLHGQQAH